MQNPGWLVGSADLHCTSFESCSATTDRRCTSLTDDLNRSTIHSEPTPFALYNDEKSEEDPSAEQKDPCHYMQEFTRLAHAKGFADHHGAGSESWQAPWWASGMKAVRARTGKPDLRLGLATCAARTGTERYHVMAQPFKARWGPTRKARWWAGKRTS